jgi:hypothetical protein
MPRALAYAWLTVLGPLHIGVAVTTVHPALDRPACWWVTALAAVVAWEAARESLKKRPEARPWLWLRLWVIRLWVSPLALLLAAHLVVTAVFLRPELGQVVQALRPDAAPPALVLSVSPPRTVPRDPVPALEAIGRLLAALGLAAGAFMVRIAFAAPPWLLTVAAGVGCLFWRRG